MVVTGGSNPAGTESGLLSASASSFIIKELAEADSKPDSVPAGLLPPVTTIHLGCWLPSTSSNQPEGADGPSFNAFLFGLAPGGGCRANPVARVAGELLPRRFTLTPVYIGAVYFLWPFP